VVEKQAQEYAFAGCIAGRSKPAFSQKGDRPVCSGSVPFFSDKIVYRA